MQFDLVHCRDNFRMREELFQRFDTEIRHSNTPDLSCENSGRKKMYVMSNNGVSAIGVGERLKMTNLYRVALPSVSRYQ